jgi:hypothetical protein
VIVGGVTRSAAKSGAQVGASPTVTFVERRSADAERPGRSVTVLPAPPTGLATAVTLPASSSPATAGCPRSVHVRPPFRKTIGR